MKPQYLRWTAVWAVVLIAAAFLIPGILVKNLYSEGGDMPSPAPSASALEQKLQTNESSLRVTVYLTKEKRIEDVPLEQYVRGVLAAEMPAEFELEALKAQAIAARTYVIRRIKNKDYSNVPVEGALVTDTVAHQAYLTEEGMKKKWPDPKEYVANKNKLTEAVNETLGQIITYQNEPIIAAFFSTSNGYTENSEEYWENFSPYLRSVKSPWDERISPKFTETVTLSTKDFASKLGIALAANGSKPALKVLEETAGHRIKQIQVGNKVFTGREVREKLGLKSSQFTWKWQKNGIELTTYGYGHGIGMSQWGANGMAKEGKTASQILRYYYSGVNISKLSDNAA